MAKKRIMLFVDGPASTRRIVDQDKKPVTIEEARRLWDAGQVKDYNLSFKRLATLAGWDFDELARQYAEMDAARRVYTP